MRWASADDSPRVRITPKLVRVIDDTTVWTHQYDASIADLFKIQAEIAYQITGALQVALDGRERLAVEARPTTDTDAYLAYLRGMASYQQGSSDTANLVVARAELEQAVARDPRFALAWSWLGRVSSLQFRTGAVRTQETRELARRAARTAIDLNPGQPEVHLGMAQVLIVEREYDAALREIQIARVGLPNAPELLQIEAQIEQRQGRWRESLASYLRAFELDPASTADSIVVHYAHRRHTPKHAALSALRRLHSGRQLLSPRPSSTSVNGAKWPPRGASYRPRSIPGRPRMVACEGSLRNSSGSMAATNARLR